MLDPFCFFNAAEQKLVILCSVKFFFLTAHFLHQCLFHNQQMADIIVGTQQIKIEIRLEIWLITLGKITCHLVLICVNNLRPCFADPIRHFIEGIFRKQIIMVKQSNIIAVRQFHRCIRVVCDAQIFRKDLIFDTFIRKITVNDPFCLCGISTSVCNAQLPVRIGLCRHRFDHLPQENFRCFVNRNHNTDQRRILPDPFSLCFSLLIRQNIILTPLIIIDFFFFKSL